VFHFPSGSTSQYAVARVERRPKSQSFIACCWLNTSVNKWGVTEDHAIRDAVESAAARDSNIIVWDELMKNIHEMEIGVLKSELERER
tara:strand:- start:34 stop:297 length:264 start_codon:yes stop_codon:yes gene_type:complete